MPYKKSSKKFDKRIFSDYTNSVNKDRRKNLPISLGSVSYITLGYRKIGH